MFTAILAFAAIKLKEPVIMWGILITVYADIHLVGLIVGGTVEPLLSVTMSK